MLRLPSDHIGVLPYSIMAEPLNGPPADFAPSNHLRWRPIPYVSCVVDGYGPVDLTNIHTPVANQPLPLLFGATYQAGPDRYRDGSPLFLVSPHSAPTLIIQGTQDAIVPPSQSLALQAALQAALQRNHVPDQYVSYNGGHGYSGLTQSQTNAILIFIFTYHLAQEHP